MLDSLSLALVLISQPIARPNMERTSKIVAPTEAKIIVKQVKATAKVESLTTCYESSFGSCWSEN